MTDREVDDLQCGDWFIEKVISDTQKYYKELETRPCHRIGAMLLQCLPVLTFMFLLVYMGWDKFDHRGLFLSPGESALLILVVALLITVWLALVVLRDTFRALYDGVARNYVEYEEEI